MNTRTALRNLRRRTRNLGSVALAGALVAVGTAGCVGGGGDGPSAPPITENSIGLHAFEGCDPLLTYFQEEAHASLEAYGEFGGPVAVDDALGAPTRGDGEAGGEGPADPSPQAPGSGNAGSDNGNVDFSGTNVQEVGVDEPDIVKTDGERLYVTQNGYLLVYGADDLAEIGKVQTVGGDAQLLVGGDRAVVLSRLWGAPPEDFPEADAERLARTAKTAIAVYDIGGDGDPVLLRRRYVEGQLQAARLAAGTVRVAVHYDAAQYIDWGDVYGEGRGGATPGDPGVEV
ncbi:MAG: beta-propeller domain-containing protein, partial [Myxococcales bacterium]|nr:beta-propeller domain-containing protein [Myxococcales bacterium]